MAKENKEYEYEPLAVQVARETLEMHYKIQALQAENEELKEYRDKYMELLNSSIDHSRQMIGGVLQLAMTPGVMEACAAAKAGEQPT